MQGERLKVKVNLICWIREVKMIPMALPQTKYIKNKNTK